MRYYCFLIITGLLALPLGKLFSQDNAQKIVDKAIEKHGGALLEHTSISFKFRKENFTINIHGGTFEYIRLRNDSSGKVFKDVLSNDGFMRESDGNRITLTAEREKALLNSLNSVVYFSLLPYRLNDPAAIKVYQEKTVINSEPYHAVKVSFTKEDGGKDYEDAFLYWFHAEAHTMDFLAYKYQTDGGGIRFRSVSEVRMVKGIRFQNYINYKVEDLDTKLNDLPELWEKGELEELSRIELENLKVDISAGQ